ncbi:hypothetical protein COV23_01070 [Candidatus Wolfebacteria bacterium CG10_big_fil_rev_8_21_14_0_10_31_9]|uniref:Peptidase M10 metallopeptidase domain-containing protein n=1 Tax=Candidatus Wolfebacteria bacterium CG10_big_fil_rev_8_21_14_0_10_31_9 TaxID=1975070 RepID=A0A2H0RCZ1_9BACT|nr:MAG: hypothetical protein COV23_01070 [Candidatus Wolfebacteria bacterium CG10_big_fil_rev_8_21_14_0_10_31_9]
MKSSQAKFFISILIIILFLGAGYYYKENVWRLLQNLLNQFQPCESPITYSIVNLDPRFGLTKAELLNNISQVEKIWETPINKELFEYSPAGDLKINLIYDYRQKSTDVLKEMGIVIGDDLSTYNTLKDKYNSLIISYNKEKAKVESLITTYNTDKSAYEKDVSYWNSRGGASKIEYNKLEKRRINLNNQVSVINNTQNSLNELINTINSIKTILNKLIATLNLKVNSYNTIGSSTGKEFNEGEYINNANEITINIYQFNNTDQLIRVLAHELGHAIGLDHIDNSNAIMYYLNEGINKTLTTDDLIALKKVCRIK